MKKYLLLVVLFVPAILLPAQGNEYVGKNEFQTETKKLSDALQSSRKSTSDLQKKMADQTEVIDSLQALVDRIMILNVAVNDSFTASSLHLRKAEATLGSQDNRITKGIYIIGLVFLLFITASFFYIRMVSVRTGKRMQEVSDALTAFVQENENEFVLLKSELRENKEHILYVSDELKEYKKQINDCIETEQERSSMIDEKVKNIAVESDINHKVNREKIISLHQEMDKNLFELDEKLKTFNSKFDNEILRISKLMVVPKEMEKEKGEKV
ncbi:MAG: hypothetical protein ACM3N9_00665 [Syntrophothermus sp.]